MLGFKHILGWLTLYVILQGCAERSFAEQTAEATNLLTPFQRISDDASVEVVNELYSLIRDSYACLFPEESAAAFDPQGDKFKQLITRMNTWRYDSYPAQPLMLGANDTLYSNPWNSYHFEQLATQYPATHELWGFFEVAARCLWDSGPSTADTYLCIWIWGYSPLQGAALADSQWRPRTEPVLYRLANDLRYNIEYAKTLTARETSNVYGSTPAELSATFLSAAQACKYLFAEAAQDPQLSAKEIVDAIQGTYLENLAQVAVVAIDIFQERLD